MQKTTIIVCFLILISSSAYAISNFNISGLNSSQYVYKIAKDSLNNFFYDEFSFRLDYKSFSYGMKFIAKLPKYDKFNPIYELKSDDISYKWDERYLSYKTDKFSALAGTFEEAFGSGIVLRAYRDKEFDIDTRLQGLLLKFYPKNFQIKAFYGALPSEYKYMEFSGSQMIEHDEDDLVAGIDFESNVAQFIKLGTSFNSFRIFPQFALEEKHTHQEILGIRALCNLKWMDLTSEYACSKKYKLISEPSQNGTAVYSYLNTYIGKFTITSAYKRYKNFDFRLNDLPTVNHSNEPLHKYLAPGKDEEGVMGEIRFIPDFSNEFVLNYAESWDRNLPNKSHLKDFYAEMRHDFENSSISAEYSHLDVYLNDKDSRIKKEKSTPSIAFDFSVNEISVLMKGSYRYIKDYKDTLYHYEPLFQTDIGYKDISISLIAQYNYKNQNDIWKQPLWLSGEIYAKIFEHTELRLFVGKEKGGEICRSGCDVAIVEYHSSSSDPFYNNYALYRKNYYGSMVPGYPTAIFDGVLSVVGGSHSSSMYPYYLPRYNQRKAINSSFTIDIAGEHIGLDYDVTITVTKVATSTNMVLQLALTESHIPYSWQDQDSLHWVERLMVPNQYGTPLDFSGHGHDVNIIALTFTLASGWVADNCELTAFVQDNDTKEVLQGTKVALPDLLPPHSIDDSNQLFVNSNLIQNYPNPFNSTTVISYRLK